MRPLKPSRGARGAVVASPVRMHRYPGQRVKTTASVYGNRQIEIFEAMCASRGRRPHELASDILLDAIREAQHDHEMQEAREANP